MISVAIANQSQHIIETLMRHLLKKPLCNFIWVANNSADTLQKFHDHPPNLLLLDINLPTLGGVEVTKMIMQKGTSSILLTTSDLGQNAPKIFEAMGYGAMDVVSLKTYNFDEDKQQLDNFIKKLDTIFLLLDKNFVRNSILEIKSSKESTPSLNPPLVVIGASTGGPLALSHVLSTFPDDANFAVIIIQHIDELFIPSLVSWLNDYSKLPVKVALPSVQPIAGEIYVAAKNKNLVINKDRQFEYIDLDKDFIYAPSIDVLFESLLLYWKVPSVAVLLTGMGRDGAHGMRKLFEKNWYTVVQDQDSCVVFGMPKTAIQLGGVCDVLPLIEIGPSIVRYLVNGE